jgi:PHP family Zn ribbon phosphoesterase
LPEIKADLHIHSCLSPCGSLEMSPSAIARRAAEAGIGAAAVTDHNSALNCAVFGECCREAGILPIYGIEVTTLEEAHVLCLFATAEQAESLGRTVYEALPEVPCLPQKFGDQVYVDKEDNILGEVRKYLISAAEISLEQLFKMTTSAGGMFIPAHIDKPVFSVPSQLGFLPKMDYTALESTGIPCPVDTGLWPVIQSSDAHYLEDIGKRTILLDTEEFSFRSIKAAVENRHFDF